MYNQQNSSITVDISSYANKILSLDDRPLFEEAVEVAKVGALRSAYIMIWLACAGSLKRRFREAGIRDNAAGSIVGQIEEREANHRAVDKYLLEEAHKYGFVSDSQLTILEHIYDMRCIYGHPYEQAPSSETVIEAASEVVDLVLSKPVKLRHGFAQQVLTSLLQIGSYLDDQESAVLSFAKTISPSTTVADRTW